MGHEQRFPPLRLNVRCRLGQATFIGTDGKGREAPRAALCGSRPHGGDQPDAGTLQLKTRAAGIQRLVLSGITRESGEMRWHQPWIQQIRA